MDWRGVTAVVDASTAASAAADSPQEELQKNKPAAHVSHRQGRNRTAATTTMDTPSGSLPRQVHTQPEHSNGQQEDDDACRVYLAPSTIPGAGLGTFAGKNFQKGDEVTPGDAVVPLRDINWHNGGEDHVNTFLWGKSKGSLNCIQN